MPLMPTTILLLVLLGSAASKPLYYKGQDDACQMAIVESIPDNLTFNSSIQNPATYDAYQGLLSVATKEILFASFYWTLRGTDVMSKPGNLALKGEKLLNSLIDKSQRVSVKIANNIGGFLFNTSDLDILSKQPNVQLAWVNVSGLVGDGVLHTKFVLADNAHAYIGSSNMDWRSLTQVKELGLALTNCPTLVSELNKTFYAYWLIGKQNRLPDTWPSDLGASINASKPWVGAIAGHIYSIYMGVSPPQFTPPNWSRDIDAILDAINTARKFVNVAVMSYLAFTEQVKGPPVFWGVIDNALRAAAFRGVRIRLLMSHWSHSNPYEKRFAGSLAALNYSESRIEVKFFVVPSFTPHQASIPFGRVNHNKYMVTESTAVVCTSNWEGSYFTNTAGVAVSIKELQQKAASHRENPSIVAQIQAIFQRDWNSAYAHWNPIKL